MNSDKKNHQNMEQHLNILAWINIAFGILGLIAAGCTGLFFIATGLVASAEDPEALGILAIVGIIMGGFILVLSLPTIIGGWGLLKRKSWARILVIVLSGLNLLNFPIGTILGGYGLWVLLNEETSYLLD